MPLRKVSLTKKDVTTLIQLDRSRQLKRQPQSKRTRMWPKAAKACFISSILNGRPIPPIYLQRVTSVQNGQSEFAVIDGRLRIGAVMEFLDGGYGLTELGEDSIAKKHQGKKFSRLPQKLQQRLLNFEFAILELSGYSKSEIQDLCELMPTHAVPVSKPDMCRAFAKAKAGALDQTKSP